MAEDGRRRVAIVYGVPAGAGGLGQQAANAIVSLARGGSEVFALGPGRTAGWPLTDAAVGRVRWEVVGLPSWLRGTNYTPLRWYPGIQTHLLDSWIGRWAARQLDRVRPDAVYLFTQVALEGLRWCRARGVPSILDNPNGGIANFRSVYEREWPHWCGGPYRGHPTQRMVDRVLREYELADRIRVSSEWARASTARELTQPAKVFTVDQPIDLTRFRPPTSRTSANALRVVFVGSIDVRKGVLRFLRGVRRAGLGPSLDIRLVGGTGTRAMHAALLRESRGLNVAVVPGDPIPAYQWADIAILPTLEDGFGFVVAEAMACGLPVILTDQSGAADWVREADAGWIIPAADEAAIASALASAIERRESLSTMGRQARRYVEGRADDRCFAALRTLIDSAVR